MSTTPRTWVVGEVITAAEMNTEIRDQFNSLFASWTAYTPAWTAATTNPGIGNGTLQGRYMLIGKTCTFAIEIVWGSTTTNGSGNYSLGLPATSKSGITQIIGGQAVTSGGRGDLSCNIGGNGTTVTPYRVNSSTNTTLAQVSDSGMFGTTWSATAALRVGGTYETS